VVAFVEPNRGNAPDNLRGHFDSVGLSRKAGLVVAIQTTSKTRPTLRTYSSQS
jgi:hypothetical protein